MNMLGLFETKIAIPDQYEALAWELDRKEAQYRYVLQHYEVGSKRALRRRLRAIQTVRKMLSAGFDLTVPPQHWYAGAFRGVDSWGFGWSANGWPSQTHILDRIQFASPVPRAIVADYKRARRAGVDDADIAIYSPSKADFEIVRFADPVMIARVTIDPACVYFFEIGRWDTAKDLEAMGKA